MTAARLLEQDDRSLVLVGRRCRPGGPPASLGRFDPTAFGLRRLAGDTVDDWGAAAVRQRGGNGTMHWASDGRWLFGTIALPDDGGDLGPLAQQAYRELFGALAAAGRPPVLRLWNYLPRINDEGSTLERYREFNIGRQQAFIAAGLDAFAGAPAACALGRGGGALSISVLAGHTRVVPLENPRQVPAWGYSRRWGPKSPTFSRAVLADAGGGRLLLLVSGTASIVGEDSCHRGDVAAQCEETLTNLHALLGVAQERGSARFELDTLDLTVYLRRPDDLVLVRAMLAAAAPQAAARAVFLEADICRSELLVEIEAHAFAPGELG